jgi:hypothetical protein
MNKEECPNIRNLEITVTYNCRSNRNFLRIYGLGWHDWSEKSMGLPMIYFRLKFILKEFTDGTDVLVSPEDLWKRDRVN